MKVLYFDCFAGISGDMTIAALLDLGLDKDEFLRKLGLLNLDGYTLDIGKTSKNGISATYFKVNLLHGNDHDDTDEHEHHVDHEHHENEHHEHHQGEHVHRNFAQIKELIENSELEADVKDMAVRIFENLAQAEGKIHGKSPQEVHFHEVGAIDSIVDIVGTALAINMLKPDIIWCSPLPTGGGMTHSMHGIIPVPAPATVELLKGIPVYDNGVKKELVTPTGAAIVKTLAEKFGGLPAMTMEKIGYGAGTRDMEIPNVLRVIYGELQEEKKTAM